jgi:hypothetical protein
MLGSVLIGISKDIGLWQGVKITIIPIAINKNKKKTLVFMCITAML